MQAPKSLWRSTDFTNPSQSVHRSSCALHALVAFVFAAQLSIHDWLCVQPQSPFAVSCADSPWFRSSCGWPFLTLRDCAAGLLIGREYQDTGQSIKSLLQHAFSQVLRTNFPLEDLFTRRSAILGISGAFAASASVTAYFRILRGI